MREGKIGTSLQKRRQSKKLLKKLKKKDRDSFIKAYDLFSDDIYRFIYFKVSDTEEAKDLTSIVFLKTWNYIQSKSVLEFRTLRALIYQIARNSIIDHYRLQKKHLSLQNPEVVKKEKDQRSEDVIEKINVSFEYENLISSIKELKDEYQEVIIFRFIEELSIKEISEIMGKNSGNIRVLIYRATRALKKIVQDSK